MRENNRTTSKCVSVIVIMLILVALVGYGLYLGLISKWKLTVSEYKISSDEISSGIRIVQLTDLHNSTFGEDNEDLIRNVSSQTPDLILITGDLLNSNETDTDIAVDLIRNLSNIAPVYISYGNHEEEYESNYAADVKALFEQAGAIVLEYDYLDFEVNGQPIRLGGIYGYCLPEMYLETREANEKECAFLQDFQNTDRYTILLCHMPVCWLINNGLDEWDVDLVFSGHVHGGQIIFPNGSGLYGPDFGWFPGKLYGDFVSTDGEKHLILSRGLGSTEVIPRFNNVPEIVVTDLVPENGE